MSTLASHWFHCTWQAKSSAPQVFDILYVFDPGLDGTMGWYYWKTIHMRVRFTDMYFTCCPCSFCFPPCWRVSFSACVSLSFPICPLTSCLPVYMWLPEWKEYLTVGQLTQIFGMPKVESSPTSPLRPLQSGAGDPAFSCLSVPHGSSPSLSVEVCVWSLSLFLLTHLSSISRFCEDARMTPLPQWTKLVEMTSNHQFTTMFVIGCKLVILTSFISTGFFRWETYMSAFADVSRRWTLIHKKHNI